MKSIVEAISKDTPLITAIAVELYNTIPRLVLDAKQRWNSFFNSTILLIASVIVLI